MRTPVITATKSTQLLLAITLLLASNKDAIAMNKDILRTFIV